MLFPTKKAIASAGALQRLVSPDSDSNFIASEDDAAIATVLGRKDLVLIYSMLTDSHRQLVTISRGVWLAVFVLILILANQS